MLGLLLLISILFIVPTIGGFFHKKDSSYWILFLKVLGVRIVVLFILAVVLFALFLNALSHTSG